MKNSHRHDETLNTRTVERAYRGARQKYPWNSIFQRRRMISSKHLMILMVILHLESQNAPKKGNSTSFWVEPYGSLKLYNNRWIHVGIVDFRTLAFASSILLARLDFLSDSR